jgi:putative phosphotransacetylase
MSKRSCDIIPVERSGKHVHLSRADIDVLFGKGFQLVPMRELSQRGQFASTSTVVINGTNGKSLVMRVVGPERDESQIELAKSDAIKLGLGAKIRSSGDHRDTASAVISRPGQDLVVMAPAIVPARHLHVPTGHPILERIGQRDRVAVEGVGDRGYVMFMVEVKVSDDGGLAVHLDDDEYNAFGVTTVTLKG